MTQRHPSDRRRSTPRGLGLVLTTIGVVGLALTGTATAQSPGAGVEVRALPSTPAAVAGVTLVHAGFTVPVYVTNAGDDRLYVVERGGRIRILRQVAGEWRITGTFLDLQNKVSRDEPEQGLLGLAFPPDHDVSGRLYVDYTNAAGDVVLVEYQRLNANQADPASARLVLRIHQPHHNRNAGWLAFKGPHLYMATGDGGAGDQPFASAQDLDLLLGKILRIDPLDPDGPGPLRYSVPADNPFVGEPGRDEIWAYGLRNPWRDSFDSQTGDLYLADVGQKRYEEIDHRGDGRGRDFGWPRLEGRHLYPSGTLCASDCRTPPIVELRHAVTGTDNCAVSGGYVSRRPGAALEGRYVFGDFCSGRIWAIPVGFGGGTLPAPLDTSLLITSFGEGSDGRLYVASVTGAIYRIDGS